ncbi:MAG: hypothetical protein GX616_05025, partial [Planctomycetes bacterium]|nr:hypothetical protein [Planctomycetota bacterium]
MGRCPEFEWGLLLGFALACANAEAGASPATQPSAAVATQPVRISVVAAPWKEMPAWQNAPDGHGQYLLFPSQYAQFEIARMQYVVTSLGVLVRELRLLGGQTSPPTPGPWKIVPELYLRQLELLGMHDGLLWVVENRPLQGRAVGGTQVLALDPTDWSMRRSLELPPGSRAVRVDDGGCWFLEGKKNIGGGARGPMGYGALVCRDFGDRETFRLAANALTTSRPAVPGGSLAGMLQTVPAPLIYWWAIDADAVYLSVVDYRGIAPNDAPICGGPSQLVRIDRNTGKQVALEAPILDYTTMANAPGQIFWVQPKYLSGGTVKNEIYRLDKQSMRISQVGTFEWRRIDALAVDRDYLWMRALAAAGEDRRTRAYSLKDFKEVPNAGTGPFEESADRCGSWLLAGDESRIWFASRSQVFEIVDNGECWARDMSEAFSA